MSRLSSLILSLALLGAVPGRSAGQARPVEQRPAELRIITGDLAHHAATNDLFHIGPLWIRITPGTALHRWLVRASGEPVNIFLTTDPSRFGDASNVRIFSGRLAHAVTPGRTSMAHTLDITDPETGAHAPLSLETKDLKLALQWLPFEDADVSLVVQVIVVD